MSNKREREKRREQRLQEETKVDAGERRTRLLQFGAGAVFLVIVAVVVLIVVNGSSSSGGDATNLKEVERGRLAWSAACRRTAWSWASPRPRSN